MFKQLAAILGDATFQAGRRWFLQNAGQIYPTLPTWSYFYNQTYPGAPAYLGGTPHACFRKADHADIL